MRNWMIYSCMAVLTLFAFALPVNADDEEDADKKREEIFGKSFGDKVEEAVDKGCDWLKDQQGIEKGEDPAIFGQFPPNPPLYGAGEPHRYRIARTAFPVQALCKSGCWPDDPHIEKAMEWLRENYTENGAVKSLQGFVSSTTYEDATVLNAVEAYYISAWETKERGYANPRKRVKEVDGKKVPLKRWGTEEKGAKKKKKDRRLRLSREDEKLCKIAVKALESRFRKAYGGGGWRYKVANQGENDPVIDVSATQYAMLGLKSATRLGIAYDKSVLMDMFHFYRGQQDKDGPKVEAHWKKRADDDDKDDKRKTSSDGEKKEMKARGWAYARQSKHHERDKMTYGSMTAAAINALILIRDELIDDRAMKRRWEKVEEECNVMIGDGLAWMVANWDMSSNPRVGHYRYYYYLYTIERLGMLGGIDYIGGHDWYVEGAQVLLDQQQPTGMWDTDAEIDPSDIYDTCYALLFLKRATAGVDQPIPVITGKDGED